MSEASLLAPEILLLAAAGGTVLVNLLVRGESRRGPAHATFVGLLLALASAAALLHHEPVSIMAGTLQIDPFAQFFKCLLILGALIVSVLGSESGQIRDENQVEFQAMLCVAASAACISLSASHLLTLFASLECVSLVCALMVAFAPASRRSGDAAIRLVAYSSMATLLFLLGVVLLYAYAHTLSIPEIQKVVAADTSGSPYFWISFALVYIAIATKISIFPFHLATPGVFGGAPTPVAALLSVVPAIAGLGLCVKTCLQIFSVRAPGAEEWVVSAGIHWPGFLAVAAATTMTLSNLMMLRQNNLKRLMALSTVVQASYLLLSIAVVSLSGLGTAMFGALVHIVSTLGAYLVLMHCMDSSGSEGLDAVRGLIWRRPAMAVAFSAFLLSLAGLPPFAGFVSRTYLIAEVIKQQQYGFAVVVAINTVLGCVPFLGLLRHLVEDAPRGASGAHSRGSASSSTMVLDITTAVLALPTLLIGVYWDTLILSISNSLRMILW